MASKTGIEVLVIVTCPSCTSKSLINDWYIISNKSSLDEDQQFIKISYFKCPYCNYIEEYIEEEL